MTPAEASFFLIIGLTVSQGPGEATEMATRAYLSQNGIDLMLDNYSRTVVTEEQRKQLGHAAIAVRALVERKVIFEWRY